MSARAPWVEELLDALREALTALDPAGLVERTLPDEPATSGRVGLLAVGKAAHAMARGAVRRWRHRIEDGLVVAPVGASQTPGLPTSLRLYLAGHPIPDEQSVAAAEQALTLASGLGPGDLLLALISGGASALLSAPPAGVPLGDKRALVAAMLDAGAPIQEVNLVRRHFSRVKGGRVAAAAAPAAALTLIVSDVIGGLPHDIGSGPTVPDPTSVDEAREALLRWAPQLDRLAPWLSESLKADPASPRSAASAPDLLQHRMLADPDTLAAAVSAALGRRGWSARAAPAEAGPAPAIAALRVTQARALAPGEALVIACEPTVALPARRGLGGRAGWIALSALPALPPDVALLCAASDGVDGSSGSAGAVVTGGDAERAPQGAIAAALAAFDDAPLHRALGTALPGGPTGHNLTDVHVLARVKPG